jgi:hypothetical protein
MNRPVVAYMLCFHNVFLGLGSCLVQQSGQQGARQGGPHIYTGVSHVDMV